MQVPTLMTELAAMVKPQTSPVTTRLGVITSYTRGSVNVGLKIGGSTTEVIGRFINYDPVVGDTVQIIQDGLDPIVIGKAGTTGPGLAIPIGMVCMWGNTVPDNWQRCEGQSTSGNQPLADVWGSTVPDLRYRFIVGAGPGVQPGFQDGQNDIAITEANLPPHTHNLKEVITSVEASGYGLAPSGAFTDRVLVDAGGNRVTGATGSGKAIDNRPFFYVVTFIVKVA